MDRWEGPAQLGFWVNHTTCIGPVDIELTVTADDAGWHATGRYAASVSGDDRVICSFLAEVARSVTLTFPRDDAQISVTVTEAGDGSLVLTAP